MLLAYATEKRLQKEGLSRELTLDQWNVEAGPDSFDETVTGVQKGIEEAGKAIKDRSADPLLKRLLTKWVRVLWLYIVHLIRGSDKVERELLSHYISSLLKGK
jgi:hypothetical protein